MKTRLLLNRFFLLLLIFIAGKATGQITYSGTPATASAATCPTTMESCSNTPNYGNIIKANVQTINGSSVTFRVRKCDGSSFSSAGTLKVILNNICGSQVQSTSISTGNTYKDITFTVSHTGTNYYRVTLYSNSDSNTYYTNQLSVTGTSAAQPDLTCGTSTVTPAQPVQGQDAHFSFVISNIGSGNYTGQLRMMWRNTTSGFQLGNTLNGLNAGASHTFTASSNPLASAPGTWYLNIEEANGNVICSKTVTVISSPATCVQGTGNPPSTSSPEYQATQYLCQNGIIIPQQNWTSNYNNAILRQDIAKITYLGLYKGNTPNSPASHFPVPFLDMQASHTGNEYWYNAAKVLAYLQYNDDKTPFDRDFILFRPDESIPRRYAIKMFLEAFNIAPSANTNNPFSDVSTSDEMYGYIKKAHELGIVLGNQEYTPQCTAGTCFHPDANLTRQDAFIILWRILTFSGIVKPTMAQLENISNYFVPGNNRISTFGNIPDLGQGNFSHYQKTSFSIGGRSSLSLDFTHTYNSFLTELPKGYFEDGISLPKQNFSPLGTGWTHTYNIYAIKTDSYTIGSYTEPAKIMFYYPDGSIAAFNYATSQPEGTGIYDVMTRTTISGGERITITTKNQIKYIFENFNNNNHFFCKSIKDRNNNGIKLIWSPTSGTPSVAKYRLTSVQEEANNGSLGRSLTFNYMSTISPYLKSVTDNSINRTIYFSVDSSAKNLKVYTDPKGQVTNYNYDVEGYLTSNLLTEIVLPKGNKIKNTYLQRKLKSSQTFTQTGIASSTTQVNWTSSYNSSGYNSNSTVTDPENRQTSYQYNTLGNPVSITAPSATVAVNSYAPGNNAHLPTSITADGITTTMSYDPQGNLLSATKNGISNTYTYNSFNDALTHKDGNGNTTNYNFDGNGNLSKIIRPGTGGSINITRNSFGQISLVSNPSGIQTSYDYNINGLPNQASMPLGITTSSNYDGASRLLSVTDANNKTTSYEYDLNDNVTKVTDANGEIVQHTYDANNNHMTIKNPKNETQTNTYNFDNDLPGSESFGNHTKTYIYNDDGSLATFTRGNGMFTYTYDMNTGRLLNDGQTQYTYDSRGNIKTITNTNGTLTLNYDNNDRLTSYSDYYGQTVSYGYDNNNNVKTITYPGNKIVSYVYDANNRCTSVTDWNAKTTTYTYLTDDRISQITLPNGTKTIYSYDIAGRPSGISNKKNNNAVISEYTFTLDNAGNHLAETISEPSIIAGLQNIIPGTESYGNYPHNRISTQGGTGFTHNTAGAITNKGNNNFTYDLNDNLLSVNGNINAQFKYDGSGNRREKASAGITTRYVLNILGMSQVLMENNSSNMVQNYYVYGPTGLLYRVKANNAYSYYHYDFRGSTTAITNEAQTVTHSYSYDPFGKIIANTEADFNPYRYVGQHGVQYENNDLMFMRARYYDPTTGRFVSEDPVWHLNLYPYADNNPIMGIDPIGKATRRPDVALRNILGSKKFDNLSRIVDITLFLKENGNDILSAFNRNDKVRQKAMINILSRYIEEKLREKLYTEGVNYLSKNIPFIMAINPLLKYGPVKNIIIDTIDKSSQWIGKKMEIGVIYTSQVLGIQNYLLNNRQYLRSRFGLK
ncbi:RHS repeat-associated protein [Chryseobacterium defluvii]|uniref:RHS repeat-associated protein n=1 Tax=Chryseobacterium defluvii TaxID=160396 RepID=A0A840KL48_9FLAO|nr:RHS repeat-associated core domain-containing protein [Chryseobacterium defluvii]MBB4807592.1 RHS repeat-associated protein [Chryseobacterium defluvii]